MIESGVERRRLARAGRPGHEDQPVGTRQALVQAVGGGLVIAEALERLERADAVDDAQHDLLAVHGGQRRETAVDRPSIDLEAEGTVLGTMTDRDVGARHDLEAVADQLRY